MSVLSSPHFHDEAKAFEYLESIVWADGVVCPKCGVTGGKEIANHVAEEAAQYGGCGTDCRETDRALGFCKAHEA